MRLLLLFISIIMLAGCFSLPPGEAPSGPIVNPKLCEEKYSGEGAKNYMLTSLSMFCVQNFPQGSSFYVDFPNSNKKIKLWSQEVLHSVRDSVAIRLVNRKNAGYSLTSKLGKNKTWNMQLREIKTEELVWSEAIQLKGNK